RSLREPGQRVAGVKVWCFFFSSRRRHTSSLRDWSSDVCSSDLDVGGVADPVRTGLGERGRAAVAPGPDRRPLRHRRRLAGTAGRSEEGRVGKGWRSRGFGFRKRRKIKKTGKRTDGTHYPSTTGQ